MPLTDASVLASVQEHLAAVGAGERLAVKALTLSTNKWPLDAGSRTVLRASVGRAGETAALQLPDDELVRLVHHELRPLIGIAADRHPSMVPDRR